MKRILVIVFLFVCAATAAIMLFPHPLPPPPAGPGPAVAEPEAPQRQAHTGAPMPAPAAPTDTAPPIAASPDLALLPFPPIPLPPKRLTLPDPGEPQPELALREVRKGSPVFIRIFKRESVLELWVHKGGRFRFVKKYPICAWSGALGPKIRVGDRQAPEGFYAVAKKQLNPNSAYYRAFNVGFPNAYDAQLGRTGSALMVHGACASVGCYAMTDPGIAEIYPLVEAALDAGQTAIPVHIFPFRMTDAALKAQTGSQWHGFWTDLKTGYDHFEKTRTPPVAFACKGRYVLDARQAAKPGCRKITGWL